MPSSYENSHDRATDRDIKIVGKWHKSAQVVVLPNGHRHLSKMTRLTVYIERLDARDSNAEPNLVGEPMADIEQFKDDLEDNPDGLVGGSRGDFMEALGEAIYARIADHQRNSIISAYLTLQEVLEANVDNLDEAADEAIESATDEFNETVGEILGV